MFIRAILFLNLNLISCISINAIGSNLQKDSTRTYELDEVIVNDRILKKEITSSSPIQLLTTAKLERLNVVQLADAVKFFTGVQVKDFGGIGGMKTVSVRSLGANHTAVSFDGITVSDGQSGQVDLSRFSLENVASLSLVNGQSDQIFQTARMFAAASVLNIRTLLPYFEENKPLNLTTTIRTGSWGFINPMLLLNYQFCEKLSASFEGEYLKSEGNYPYVLHYGGKNDSTSLERRNNSDVENLRLGFSTFSRLNATSKLNMKSSYYQSRRGLPGNVLYDLITYERMNEKHFFIQSYYENLISSKWMIQSNAKFNYSYQRFLDPDVPNIAGKTEDIFHQREYYVSTTGLYKPIDRLSFSLAIDGALQNASSNLSNFAFPRRYSVLAALSGQYSGKIINVTATLLNTTIFEHTKQGPAANDVQKLTPSISASVKPLQSEEFFIRGFYKSIFRLPSFNDLYYTNIGNALLKPEFVYQYGIGMTWMKSLNPKKSQLAVTVDGFYNRIKDKIIAQPGRNPMEWTMLNLGKVSITGIDLGLQYDLKTGQYCNLSFSANGSYQSALDKTRVGSKTYDNQIAYTPKFSGSSNISAQTPWLTAGASMLYSGKRYKFGQNKPEYALDPYYDLALSLCKELKIKSMNWNVKAEVLNILDKNYQVIADFPMPGRSFRFSLSLKY